MRRLLSFMAAAVCLLAVHAAGEVQVIEVNTLSTTHVVFLTDLSYVDVSRQEVIVARIVDASKNMLALKARAPFDFETTISALEANGTMHTFKVRYSDSPERLVVDTRSGADGGPVNTQRRPGTDQEAGLNVAGGSSNFGQADAPTLQEVVALPQRIFDIGDRAYRIQALCTNIFVYSDVMYIVIELQNSSDIGYEAGEAQFTVESAATRRRSLSVDKTLWARSSYGSLSCGPRQTSIVGYTVPKTTLLKGEELCIYIYEKNGTRNLKLRLLDSDVNYAVAP